MECLRLQNISKLPRKVPTFYAFKATLYKFPDYYILR